ncbi:hypothetical protein BP5796_03772 [Coleophoma crateriformis]|uniref:F-box domain-containing protein n=1 Tax=Coleophoma crateriformis TaxID=565419 RepID=A0A3D8SGG7_9HELO|nr:hypothetical protein BP5796_03772 [Coleophoma crateriformis]
MPTSGKQKGTLPLLPTEILWKILSDACLEVADFLHLSCVNKRLSQVVRQKLYEEIVLNSDQPMAVEQLLTSLSANTHLLRLIHHLKLRSLPGRKWVAIPERINLALKQILRLRLPALESLAWEMSKIDINVYELDPMLPVRSVHVNRASVEQSVALMLLPNIQCIHIDHISDTVQQCVPSYHVGKGSKFSTAKNIRIDGGFTPHIALSPFMNWPWELQFFHGSVTIDDNLSPTSFDRYLEPARDTLIDLSVVVHTDEFTSVDGTFIYFDTFKCLKHLNSTASLLFGSSWASPTAERAGLYRRLPTTLESLTVFFDNLSKAVGTGREEVYTGTETPPDYVWIMELTNLPNFKYLRIKESLLSGYHSPNFESFQWVPHHIILDCFGRNSIEFEASLRSYKQYAVAVAARMTRIRTRREAARALTRTATTQ